jgi:hypothetical protein
MPTIHELFAHAQRDVQNHYGQFLTGQNAPMISPDSAPAAEAPYGGMSHSEKDVMISAPSGEAAPTPTGLNGETLAPEQEAQPWPSAFARLASHQVTDADYTDISGQAALTGPQPDSSPEQGPHSGFEPEL